MHQFHDIIPGSGIHWVYEDTARDHAHILTEARRLTTVALERMVEGVDTTASGHPVVACNSLSHARHELVTVDAPDGVTAVADASGRTRPVQRDADGRVVFEATVPPCGYQVYDLVTEGATGDSPYGSGPVAVSPSSLENDHLRIELDDQGLLASVYDKSAGRQALAPGARAIASSSTPTTPTSTMPGISTASRSTSRSNWWTSSRSTWRNRDRSGPASGSSAGSVTRS